MKPFPFNPRLLLALMAASSLTIGAGYRAMAAEQTPATESKETRAQPAREEIVAAKDKAATSKEKVESTANKAESTPKKVESISNQADAAAKAIEEAAPKENKEAETAAKEKDKPAAINVSGDFSVEGADKEHEAERKELESVLSTIETQWNAHDIKAVMSNYADEYINNDGLDKKAVQKLTEDFWKQYPDAHAVSKTKSIRIEGNFATVESRDISSANCEMSGMNKGELQSVSEGQQYFKRLGNVWRITGDRIDFEKVRVAFGLAKQLNAAFTAPEQVRAGKQFSAKLEVALPPGFRAIGSITNQPLTFPQHTPMEKTRVLDTPPVLERVMGANIDARNELLTATVILVTPGEKPMGLAIMTRRLNVVPDLPGAPDATSTASAAKAGQTLSEANKNSKDEDGAESSAEKDNADKVEEPSKE